MGGVWTHTERIKANMERHASTYEKNVDLLNSFRRERRESLSSPLGSPLSSSVRGVNTTASPSSWKPSAFKRPESPSSLSASMFDSRIRREATALESQELVVEEESLKLLKAQLTQLQSIRVCFIVINIHTYIHTHIYVYIYIYESYVAQ